MLLFKNSYAQHRDMGKIGNHFGVDAYNKQSHSKAIGAYNKHLFTHCTRPAPKPLFFFVWLKQWIVGTQTSTQLTHLLILYIPMIQFNGSEGFSECQVSILCGMSRKVDSFV